MADALSEAFERVRLVRRLPPPTKRRWIRESAGLVQDDIAKDVGVSREAIARYEAGTRTPRGPALRRYIDALDRIARELLA